MLAGASLSFGVAIAAHSRHPEHVIWLAFWICVGLLAIAIVIETFRQGWLSAEMQYQGRAADGRALIMLALNNHGGKDIGVKIVNLLLPESVGLVRATARGAMAAEQRELLPAHEPCNGELPTHYWSEKPHIALGTQLYWFLLDTDREEVPFILNVAEKRRPFALSLTADAINVPHAANFSRAKASVARMRAAARRVRMQRSA